MPDESDIAPGTVRPCTGVAWLAVDVVHDAGNWPDIEAVIANIQRASHALARHPLFAGYSAAEACIALSSDEAVKTLNAQFRGKDQPTNVLSFPATQIGTRQDEEPPSERRFLGDVVLALETVQHEATTQEIGFDAHLAHLTIHGLLHLMDYDHDTDERADVMERLEVEILADLGIATPYPPVSSSQDEFSYA